MASMACWWKAGTRAGTATGWTNADKFDFLKPYPDFDLEELAKYAQSKGVRLIGHHETAAGVDNYERQMDAAFAQCQRLGIRAVKTGYVGHGQNIRRIDADGKEQREWHHGQYMVRHYRKVVEAAARHQVMLDVHEPIKATGIRRTFPNMMTREGACGQEFNAWGGERRNRPDHTTILPFTRLLGGPMDFTPGIFDLLFEEHNKDNRVSTTLAKQLALYVVIYSPLHMAADLPENYLAKPKPFQFIKDVPTDWAKNPRAQRGDRRFRHHRAEGSQQRRLVSGQHYRRAGAQAEAALEFSRCGPRLRRRNLPGRAGRRLGKESLRVRLS
jgi:alpha-glucosidase